MYFRGTVMYSMSSMDFYTYFILTRSKLTVPVRNRTQAVTLTLHHINFVLFISVYAQIFTININARLVNVYKRF
jgi:hypothetical protein